VFATALAARHLADVLTVAMEYRLQDRATVVFDDQSYASRGLTASYRQALPCATFIDFYATQPEHLLAHFNQCASGDLVVLVQTQSFRMPNMRIRVELFKRDIKMIEHSNLARITDEQSNYYVDALEYDVAYYRGVGAQLKVLIDAAHAVHVYSGDSLQPLRFDAGCEISKLNTGDFSALRNIGSLFPIGEVFTESKDLEQVAGQVQLFGFADLLGNMNFVDTPIAMVIEAGRVVDAPGAPENFVAVLDGIRGAEGGEVWVRELGFGMNRAFGPHRRVNDVGAFERQCGVHLSLGAKHGVYKKPSLRHKEARYHVDVFPLATRVVVDEIDIFVDGRWRMPPA
jgi:aminopeptidase